MSLLRRLDDDLFVSCSLPSLEFSLRLLLFLATLSLVTVDALEFELWLLENEDELVELTLEFEDFLW